MESQSVLHSLFKVLFPDEITLHFEIKDVKEFKTRIDITMEELPELVPSDLSGTTEIALDGFCNPLELQSFPLKGKSVYLKLYRRRWKKKGEKKHYSNRYNFHPDGVKFDIGLKFIYKSHEIRFEHECWHPIDSFGKVGEYNILEYRLNFK